MSLTFILSLTVCGGGIANVKATNDDESISTVVTESLKSQLQKVTPVTDCDSNTFISEMDIVTFGLDKNSQPIEWMVLEKSNNKALLILKYLFTSQPFDNEKKIT